MSTIDLTQIALTREQMAPLLPHRHEMALLNHVVWYSPDFKEGVALKRVRDDEFWVRGHFPGRPLLPGVLQLEAGAQLAAFLYNLAVPEKPLTPAFTRIEHCSFRSMVQPGDDFYLLCKEVKRTRRGFTCDIQGVCNQRLTFDARIQGLII
jgi:3-hydroxyacyl-[acyl-carrier-protein] dehydratase